MSDDTNTDNTDGDSTTTDPMVRHPYTNDAVTLLLMLNASGLLWGGAYALYTGAIPPSAVMNSLGGLDTGIISYAIAGFIVAMAVWLYGDGFVTVVQKLRQ